MTGEVKDILSATQYSVVATVTQDAKPWSVPLRFAFSNDAVFFRSSPDSVHSKNIASDPSVSIVVYDTSQATKGAVYINSRAEVLHGEERGRAVQLFNQRFNNPPDQWDRTDYFRVTLGVFDSEKSGERMYYFQEREG